MPKKFCSVVSNIRFFAIFFHLHDSHYKATSKFYPNNFYKFYCKAQFSQITYTLYIFRWLDVFQWNIFASKISRKETEAFLFHVAYVFLIRQNQTTSRISVVIKYDFFRGTMPRFRLNSSFCFIRFYFSFKDSIDFTIHLFVNK